MGFCCHQPSQQKYKKTKQTSDLPSLDGEDHLHALSPNFKKEKGKENSHRVKQIKPNSDIYAEYMVMHTMSFSHRHL